MKLTIKTTLAIALAALFSVFALADVPPDAVWIDVRTPAEYEREHLPQATLIPYDSIEKGIAGLNLARDTPIYLYCGSGARAEKARASLQALDYTEVTNAGGLADARQLLSESKPQ